MSRITNDIINSLRKSMKASDRKTSAYDTQATIRRIEGNTAWVHIPGGVDETPVQMTINAKEGDQVQVRVSGGRAFLVGNATAPPTDDSYARRLGTLLSNDVANAKIIIKRVQRVVQIVKDIADNTNQYFWNVEEGTDTGAHITEKPQDEFLADPSSGGPNLLIRSNGLSCRDGTEELAIFSALGIRLGKLEEPHAMFTADASEFAGADGSVVIQNNANGVTTFTEGGLRFYQDDVQLTLEHEPVDGSFVVFSSGASQQVTIMDPSTITYSGSGKTITVHTGSSSGLHPVTTAKIYVTYDTLEFPTTAVGIGSFENGFGAGQNSVAIGKDAMAYGEASLSQGKGTIARGEAQAVFGKYNVPDRESLIIAGNGTADDDRSNAFKVDKGGNGYFSGDLNVEGRVSGKKEPIYFQRISNSYVNDTNFDRITGYRVGDIVVVNMNLSLSAALPKSSDFVNIGTIIDLTFLQDSMMMVPAGNSTNAGVALVEITPGGVIRLYNYSNTTIPAGSWLRCTLTLVVN